MGVVTALTAAWTVVRIVQGGIEIWNKLKGPSGAQQGLIVHPQGTVEPISRQSGVLSIPQTPSSYQTTDELPISLSGDFLLEESLDWLRGNEVILLFVFDESYESRGDFYLFSFDFDGYAIQIQPGDYSFYVFILDPEAPTMPEAEILAVGYPNLGEITDPNPITLSGYGGLGMDMLVFDRDMFYDVPQFLGDLGG